MMKEVTDWLAKDPDPSTQTELKQLIDQHNDAELAERFQSRLAFGTAGLRGKVGCGPNRMNRLVILETTTGLGNYLIANITDARQAGVIIGYDGRTDSKTFAHDAASVLLAQGFTVYLVDQYSPTPVIAFGIKHLKACAGIVVTASHNPPEYNGFKVYWENGAQIIPPHDSGIAQQIDIAARHPIQTLPLREAEQQGQLVWLSDSFFKAYHQAVLEAPVFDAINYHPDATLSIAYTAMHGVGAPLAESLLASAGYKNVHSVAEQREPDGSFPTVNFPNPEEPGAMDKVIALAKQTNASIACANDPDADRFAVAAKTPTGDYQMLTGDQVGILLGSFLLETQHQGNHLVGNTIVSSRLLEKLANEHCATYYQTLTGFKWLSNVAMEKQTAECPFLFAYEEALGYTIGQNVWDKDGMMALVTFVTMIDMLQQQGLSVWDKLEQLYRQYGFYATAQQNIALDASKPSIGAQLRKTPPTSISGRTIVRTDDYQSQLMQFADGTSTPLDLPTSDVISYYLEDDSRIIIRPSGTEPKIKCYYELVYQMNDDEDFWQAQIQAKQELHALICHHQDDIAKL